MDVDLWACRKYDVLGMWTVWTLLDELRKTSPYILIQLKYVHVGT